jgi:SAM-dependent methyltransferase
MGFYEDRVLPRLVDLTCGQGPIMQLRGEVCAGLTGRVIEIGFGSGLNLDALPADVTSLDAVEPNDLAWRRSSRRRDAAQIRVRRVGLDGQDLDAPDAAYDAALVTFALCTIPDPARALSEVRRVLRPGATVHFLEHGLADRESTRRWQRRLEPIQRRVAGGCHLTRDPEVMVRDAGFAPDGVAHTYLGPGPGRPFGYLTWGRAARDPGRITLRGGRREAS